MVYRDKFHWFVFCNGIMFTFVNSKRSENRIFLEDTTMDYAEMKDRIAHIIRAKNLTAAEFAVQLGIQPSNISHLLSGRNNPSLDFVKKLKETFPEYNLDWIIFGRGPMTVSEPFAQPAPIPMPQEPERPVKSEKDPEILFDPLAQEQAETRTSIPADALPKGIILLFDDDTYKFLSPR